MTEQQQHWFIILYKLHGYNTIFLFLYTLQHATTKDLVSVTRCGLPLPISPLPTPTIPFFPSALFSVSTCLYLFGFICSFIHLFCCWLPSVSGIWICSIFPATCSHTCPPSELSQPRWSPFVFLFPVCSVLSPVPRPFLLQFLLLRRISLSPSAFSASS